MPCGLRAALLAAVLVGGAVSPVFSQPADWYFSADLLTGPAGFSMVLSTSFGAYLANDFSRGQLGLLVRGAFGTNSTDPFQRLPSLGGFGVQTRADYDRSDVGFVVFSYRLFGRGLTEFHLTVREPRHGAQLEFSGFYTKPENIQLAAFGLSRQASQGLRLFAGLHIREHVDWVNKTHQIWFGPQFNFRYQEFLLQVFFLREGLPQSNWQATVKGSVSFTL